MVINAVNLFNQTQFEDEVNIHETKTIEYLLDSMCQQYFKSELFEKKCEFEFLDMMDYVTDLDNKHCEMLIQRVYWKDFCKCLIDYLINNDESEERVDTHSILKMFRLYIEGGNMQTDKTITSWTVDDWNRS